MMAATQRLGSLTSVNNFIEKDHKLGIPSDSDTKKFSLTE
jgi:hypothetical protein